MLAGAKNYTLDTNGEGDLLASALIGTSIWVSFKGVGDEKFSVPVEARDQAGTLLSFTDDSYGIRGAHDHHGAWVLSATITGGTSELEFVSGSDGLYWKQL